MPFCPTCNEYAFGAGHQCPPSWHVWPKGNEEGFDPDEATVVYADSAKDAATKFADEHTDCDAWEDDLFIRPVGQDGDALRYQISHYIQPVYEASLLAPAAATIQEGKSAQ